MAQLGNRIQHALRAYTPSEMKAVKIAAESFRPNPAFDTEAIIGELGVGEALVSTLDEKGVPTIVERTFIRPPYSRVGPANDEEKTRVIEASPIGNRYLNILDRESAFEILNKKEEELEAKQAQLEEAKQIEKQREDNSIGGGILGDLLGGNNARGRKRRGDNLFETAAKSMVRQAGSSLARSLVRGILGSLKK